MTGFQSQGNLWRVAILVPVSYNKTRCLSSVNLESSCYQCVGKTKNLFIVNSEDMQNGSLDITIGPDTDLWFQLESFSKSSWLGEDITYGICSSSSSLNESM